MSLMGLLAMVVVGFVVGLIGRALMPGEDKMGFLMTAGLGIAGSFVGGFIGQLFGKGAGPLQPAGLIMSIVGALIVLFVVRKLRA